MNTADLKAFLLDMLEQIDANEAAAKRIPCTVDLLAAKQELEAVLPAHTIRLELVTRPATPLEVEFSISVDYKTLAYGPNLSIVVDSALAHHAAEQAKRGPIPDATTTLDAALPSPVAF